MPRRRALPPLSVLLNNRLVGHLLKQPSGAIAFRYDASWLSWEHAIPVSLSLPLREDPFRGEAVAAVFENLLPDSDALRRRVAEKVGAHGIDAYSLLAKIGRDCVGALQFVASEHEIGQGDSTELRGESIDDTAIAEHLKGLAQSPLGLGRDDAFRISLAGAQEKTALLRLGDRWLKPHGTTPTSHILKTPIGRLPNGIDLSHSVENEYHCLKLAEAFGLPVNTAEIGVFDDTKALVIERFDRRWTRDGRLLRLPQEDCCQALSVPPTLKYQSDGGPGIAEILKLLDGSDTPAEDRTTFLAAQMVFWIIGATDGHAKNFSLFLAPRGRYHLTPLYDVLSAQPSLDGHQIRMSQMKLAMSLGKSRYYRIDGIHPRHFLETAQEAGMPKLDVRSAVERILSAGEAAFDRVADALPEGFPGQIHESISAAARARLRTFETIAIP